jgi:aryl-alcohol dehydrogenase-like predicted oxidoreductase
MLLHAFGNTSLRVSELGLGCARLGGAFQGGPRPFLDVISAAYDAGINFFDTADMYSQGESEQLVGRALRGRRDRVIIASKAGYQLPARRRLVGLIKPLVRPAIRLLKLRRDQLPAGSRGEVTQDFSAQYLTRAVEGSLRRLKTDYLDLFQLHSPTREAIERGDFEPAVDALLRAGKIRYFGIAVDSVDAFEAALARPAVRSVQFTLNLLEPTGAPLFAQAGARGVGGIARECLANGLLVKRAEDIDLAQYCSSPEELARRQQQLAELRGGGRDLLQQALAYPRAQPGVSVALVGVRSVLQLNPLLRAVGL